MMPANRPWVPKRKPMNKFKKWSILFAILTLFITVGFIDAKKEKEQDAIREIERKEHEEEKAVTVADLTNKLENSTYEFERVESEMEYVFFNTLDNNELELIQSEVSDLKGDIMWEDIPYGEEELQKAYDYHEEALYKLLEAIDLAQQGLLDDAAMSLQWSVLYNNDAKRELESLASHEK
jgi:hypothetical protein